MRNTIRPLVSGRYLHVASVVLTLAVLMMPVLLATQTAHAQTYSVFYAFTGGNDGAYPYAALVRDKAGNLYGTTLTGGLYGYGTVFKLTKSGKETVLYNFKGAPDGANPLTGLMVDSAGNFYGTTTCGGSGSCTNGESPGCGTVFKLAPKSGGGWNETVVHNFAGSPTDGQNPVADLIMDKAGNLYGTTWQGGASDAGTVFKLDTSDAETVLYSFAGTGDGNGPKALVADMSGNLYGTATGGGARNLGTVFKLDMADKEAVLYSFKGGVLGELPNSDLVRHANGDLFGTTELGNSKVNGTIFKVSKAGKMTVLHQFRGGFDGAAPQAGLVQDKAGNLYGTTYGGGASGVGTVFKLDTGGQETVLHTFTVGTDGRYPKAVPTVDKAGNLYGTTPLGGGNGCGGSGCGVVFKITP